MMASCTSSKIGLVNTAPANQTFAATAPAADPAQWAPAAAQGAPADEAYASASAEMPAAATISAFEQAKQENLTGTRSARTEAKKPSLATRMVTKALVKKLEKADGKFDLRQDKAKKAGKVTDPTIRLGIIVAAVGLGLILLAALLGPGGGIFYGLGSIALLVGLIIILLAALDVI